MSQKAEAVIAKLQAFYFKAMLAGYASDAKPKPVPGKPGYKMHEFREGNLYLIDEWCTTPDSDFSFGGTTIWMDDNAVWHMSYMGYYEGAAIPILRNALKENYWAGIFEGGRGRVNLRAGDYVYYSNQANGDFRNFHGREGINYLGTPSREMGFHNYSGMILVNPETLAD